MSERTVRPYLKMFEETGDVKPRPRRSGPLHLFGEYEQLTLLRLILENPGIYMYLHEIQQQLLHMFGVDVSVPTICKTLKFMGCSRQKIQHIALQRSEVCRARFMSEISIYDPAMLVWVDETGCDRRNSMRKFGYSVRGIPPHDHRLLARDVRYSGIAVMSLEGMQDVQLVEGTVNQEKFGDLVINTLIPILKPFDGNNNHSILIIDNCAIHHLDQVLNLVETRAKAKVIFLPPYSPDLMPLEEAFIEVKSIMKANDEVFQASTQPRTLLAMAFSMVTTENCFSFIQHSGYIP